MEEDVKCETSAELIFFDTFSHENNQELNLDLVQFLSPVLIEEIRIIPLGARVEADFPGGVRLGATNPSSFEVQFYINDLTKLHLCTFSDFGRFDYKQNVNIQYIPEEPRPTDGLLIHGSYRTLTLAIFGEPTNVDAILTKKETPSTPIPETLSQMSSVSGNILPEDEISEKLSTKSPNEAEDFGQVLTRLTQPLLTNKKVNPSNSHTEDKDKDFKIRSPDIGSSSINNDEGNSVQSSKFRNRSNQDIKLNSPRSPISIKSSPSPSSFGSGTYYRSPNLKRNIQNHSPSPQKRSPSISCFCQSPRSPKSIRSRSSSPWNKNKLNSSRSSSAVSQISSFNARSYSPLQHSPSARTPPSFLKSHVSHRKRHKSSSISPENQVTNKSSNYILPVNSDFLDPISPEQSLSDLAENISEDENLGDIDTSGEDDSCQLLIKDSEAFESISSEEEYFDDSNLEESNGRFHFSDYEMNDYCYIYNFDPFLCEFSPLQYIRDPSLTNYEHNQICNLKEEDKIYEMVSLIEKCEDNRACKWVESVEILAKMLPRISLNTEKFEKVAIEWLIHGLNFELALKQKKPTYKVRHLKAGIKLAISFFNTNETTVTKLLEMNIPLMLVYLYYKPYMSLPLKLLIIRGLDAVCDNAAGVEYIINHTENWTLEDSQIFEETCYQRLLNILLSSPATQLAVALKALFKKIHFYELLKILNQSILNPCDRTESKTEAFIISEIMEEISLTYLNGSKLIAQKLGYLPSSSFFEVKSCPFDCYLSIYKWFKHFKIVDCLIAMISRPDLEQLNRDVYKFVKRFSAKDHFLNFLLGPETFLKTNELLSHLIQTYDDLDNISSSIGITLSYDLQAYHLVDSIFVILTSNAFNIESSSNDPELCSLFHRLFSLTFTPNGRKSVIKCLSSSNNFDILLKFLTSSRNESLDAKVFKSTCAGYACQLCLLTIQFCDDNILHILNQYGSSLLTISTENNFSKLSILSNWLSPYKAISCIDYSENTFQELMAIVKNQAELASNLVDGEVFNPSPQLITTLRILEKLCISLNEENFYQKGFTIELKYFYAINQVFTFDGLTLLLTILQKLCETYLRPSHQASSLVGIKGQLVASLIKPIIQIIKEILIRLICARGSDFKDTSPIPILVKVYSLLLLFPSSSFAYENAQKIIPELVNILVLYTNLPLTTPDFEEESLKKNIWTKMIKEVLQYTFSLPMFFIHGLSLLSELLPLPLPLQTLKPLEEGQVKQIINFRKLWSAHLLILANDLEKLITNFVLCSSSIIQQLLRRICVQLSDLSSPASTLVVRCVLEALLNALPSSSEEKLSISLFYVLNLLSYLSTHPPFKLAFIHTVHIGDKLDEKYSSIVAKLLRLLKQNTAIQINSNINQLVLDFLYSLCNPDINLDSEAMSVLSFQTLSNSLPSKESMMLIANTLLNHIDLSELSSQNFNEIASVFRIFTLFCENDYGFVTLKHCIFEKSQNAIYSTLSKTQKTIKSYDSNEETFQSLVCSLVEMIKCLIFFKNDEQSSQRTLKLTYSEICSLLKFTSVEKKLNEEVSSLNKVKKEKRGKNVHHHFDSKKEDKKEDEKLDEDLNKNSNVNSGNDEEISTSLSESVHPLVTISKYIDSFNEESLELIKQTLNQILDYLSNGKEESTETIIQEVHLPPLEPFPLQFSKREVFRVIKNIDNEKLNPRFWLSMPTFFEQDQSNQLMLEKVRVNFIEMSEKYLSEDFNIRKTLQEIYKYQDSSEMISNVKIENRKLDPIVTTKDSKSFANVKKSFIAPMRGRGYTRPGGAIHSTRANDPFRSRPPNTSRPPSMHVDDFVALEQSTTNCNNFESSLKRKVKEFSSKPKSLTNTNPSSHSFGSTSSLLSRSTSPYYSESYLSRRTLNNPQFSNPHQSPSRSNGPIASTRSTFPRYSRENYSPSNSRSTRSGSNDPSSASQHWTKTASIVRRESRDSKSIRSFAR